MIAISPPSVERRWEALSFPSTLYLQPILDLLIGHVPSKWQAEVRLGLQEALVNAAKHGNQLDPAKPVLVRYSAKHNQFWWIIADQGHGFDPPLSCSCRPEIESHLAKNDGDCGRGLLLLHQIFDQVHWTSQGRELHLCKRIRLWARGPLVC